MVGKGSFPFVMPFFQVLTVLIIFHQPRRYIHILIMHVFHSYCGCGSLGTNYHDAAAISFWIQNRLCRSAMAASRLAQFQKAVSEDMVEQM